MNLEFTEKSEFFKNKDFRDELKKKGLGSDLSLLKFIKEKIT